jgi:hypothetical protein
MSRAPSTFRKRDVSRACEAVRKTGLKIAKVEIGTDGKIVLVTAQDEIDETESKEIKL